MGGSLLEKRWIDGPTDHQLQVQRIANQQELLQALNALEPAGTVPNGVRLVRKACRIEFEAFLKAKSFTEYNDNCEKLIEELRKTGMIEVIQQEQQENRTGDDEGAQPTSPEFRFLSPFSSTGNSFSTPIAEQEAVAVQILANNRLSINKYSAGKTNSSRSHKPGKENVQPASADKNKTNMKKLPLKVSTTTPKTQTTIIHAPQSSSSSSSLAAKKRKEQEALLLAESNDDEVVQCACSKSKCLKMYCPCFAKLRECNSAFCKCVDCHNLEQFHAIRHTAICRVLHKTPRAFKRHSGVMSCNCRKSFCLKLYCDCFSKGQRCTPGKCSCKDCQNFEGSQSLIKVLEEAKQEGRIFGAPINQSITPVSPNSKKRPFTTTTDKSFARKKQHAN